MSHTRYTPLRNDRVKYGGEFLWVTWFSTPRQLLPDMQSFLTAELASWGTGWCDVCGDEAWGEEERYCEEHYRSEVLRYADEDLP